MYPTVLVHYPSPCLFHVIYKSCPLSVTMSFSCHLQVMSIIRHHVFFMSSTVLVHYRSPCPFHVPYSSCPPTDSKSSCGRTCLLIDWWEYNSSNAHVSRAFVDIRWLKTARDVYTNLDFSACRSTVLVSCVLRMVITVKEPFSEFNIFNLILWKLYFN